MILGLFYGIAACLLWGTSYVAPLLLPSYSPNEILLGRYLAFGFVAFFLKTPSLKVPNFRAIFCLAFLGYLCYDFLDILNIRIHSSESVALLYGITLLLTPPIIDFISKKEIPSTENMIRISFLLMGLFFLEWQEWRMLDSSIAGWVIAISQAAIWVYYTRTLSKSPENSTRSVIVWIGIFCFSLSLLGWAYYLFFEYKGPLEYLLSHTLAEWKVFIGVSLISGIGYGWLATHFWCLASKSLHYSLLSALLLADIVAGRLYGEIINNSILSPIHFLGILIILIASLPWKKLLLNQLLK